VSAIARHLRHDRETIRAYLAGEHIAGHRRPGPTRTGRSIVATMATMATEALPTVIVLNGASSVGKSTLAVAVQNLLPKPFLHVGVDTLLAAMPPSSAGIAVADDGSVAVAGDFQRLELAWYAGLAAMASCGAGLIIDEVFLAGQTSQQRLANALGNVSTMWIGVHCRLDIAVNREANRPDRSTGMAASQASAVHGGVKYDLEIDTTDRTPSNCARDILGSIAGLTGTR